MRCRHNSDPLRPSLTPRRELEVGGRGVAHRDIMDRSSLAGGGREPVGVGLCASAGGQEGSLIEGYNSPTSRLPDPLGSRRESAVGALARAAMRWARSRLRSVTASW
jgi:hypothetical protein